jgi:hypothetical protein
MNPHSYASIGKIIRPANVSAYSAGSVVGVGQTNGVANGLSSATEFAGIANWKNPGRELMITSASLRIDLAAIPSTMGAFRLQLYNANPDGQVNTAVWDLASAGDRSKYQGYIDFSAPVDIGSTLYVQADAINHQVTLTDPTALAANSGLWGILMTVPGWTPAATADEYYITLHTVAL